MPLLVLNFSWGFLPTELLKEVLQYLAARDLASCAAVNRLWGAVARSDSLWQSHLEKEFLFWHVRPEVTDSLYGDFAFFKGGLPTRLIRTVDDFGYKLHRCTFSSSGTFLAVSGDMAHFCIYRVSPWELLEERCLSDGLSWTTVNEMQFSPDEKKLMLSGTRLDGAGELVVYTIEDPEVHFLCRMPSSPSSFHGCWFGDDNILAGDYHIFDINSRIAQSLSQLYLCSLPKHRNSPSDICLLASPLICSRVSPRFRRVVQLTRQARDEGKSLAAIIGDLDLQSDVSWDGDLSELRKVLDLEEQCFRCYLKHKLTEEEYGGSTECLCMCHSSSYRLLIYVAGQDGRQLCFKLIDQPMLSEALNMQRFKRKEETSADEDYWSYIRRRVDDPDHVIEFEKTIHKMELSPDERHVFVSLRPVLANNDDGIAEDVEYELGSVDLEKMVRDPLSCCGSVKTSGAEGGGCVAVADNLVASCSQNEVVFWSRQNRGLPIGRCDVGGMASWCSLDACSRFVAVLVGVTLQIRSTSHDTE